MAQLTIRLDDGLARAIKEKAHREGCSVNALATSTLQALVDPDLAGDEAERVRERLRRAGLLVEPVRQPPPTPPPAGELARARVAAGQGTSLSTYVSEGRG